jgi:hypothetical protein
MMYAAKCVLVAVLSLMPASSRISATTPVDAVEAALKADAAGSILSSALPLARRVGSGSAAAPELPLLDAALVFMLGAGLVTLQLRRRQKSLHGPRVML